MHKFIISICIEINITYICVLKEGFIQSFDTISYKFPMYFKYKEY